MVMYYTFPDKKVLLAHAKTFVSTRVNSLESDATHCIPADPQDERIAPFPIVLYCFSTIVVYSHIRYRQIHFLI